MTHCTDPRMKELLGAYALGACPPDEAEAMRAHLDACPSCARALADLQAAREALLTTVPPAEPGPELKQRVMAQVRADAALFAAAQAREGGAAAEPARGGEGFWARLRGRLSAPIPLVTALACGVALVIGGVVLGSALIGGSSGSDDNNRVVVGRVDPAAAPGGKARIVERGGQARLVVEGMPDPGAGRVYEVWLQTGDGPPRPTKALFSVNSDGSGETAVPSALTGVDRVLVSSEPAGGSKVPTRTPVVAIGL